MADFSSKLRDIIESRGVTQSWLAEKTGATEATISRYLSGVHKPNLDIVARIAQALNVSIDYIMDLSLSPTPYKEPEREIVIQTHIAGQTMTTRTSSGACWTPTLRQRKKHSYRSQSKTRQPDEAAAICLGD